MIRRVAFKKAIIAGVAGAAAWEVVVRSLILAGAPLFDLVHTLGTLLFGSNSSWWKWWPVGMTMHALVGAIWAVFYAYFFWSLFDIAPFLQGVIFAVLPTILAGFIMVPQMDLMLDGGSPSVRLGVFADGIGWFGPMSVVLGHLIYGVVMGAIYVRPVGYAVGKHEVHYG